MLILVFIFYCVALRSLKLYIFIRSCDCQQNIYVNLIFATTIYQLASNHEQHITMHQHALYMMSSEQFTSTSHMWWAVSIVQTWETRNEQWTTYTNMSKIPWAVSNVQIWANIEQQITNMSNTKQVVNNIEQHIMRIE